MLRSDAQFLIEPFLKAVALASGRLLMLDYDGTLAPFHDERDSAFPYPGVAATLQDIIRGGHTRVVIVSGRGVDDLIPLLGIQPIPEIWGGTASSAGDPMAQPKSPMLSNAISRPYRTPAAGSNTCKCTLRPSSRPEASQYIGVDEPAPRRRRFECAR